MQVCVLPKTRIFFLRSPRLSEILSGPIVGTDRVCFASLGRPDALTSTRSPIFRFLDVLGNNIIGNNIMRIISGSPDQYNLSLWQSLSHDFLRRPSRVDPRILFDDFPRRVVRRRVTTSFFRFFPVPPYPHPPDVVHDFHDNTSPHIVSVFLYIFPNSARDGRRAPNDRENRPPSSLCRYVIFIYFYI